MSLYSLIHIHLSQDNSFIFLSQKIIRFSILFHSCHLEVRMPALSFGDLIFYDFLLIIS